MKVFIAQRQIIGWKSCNQYSLERASLENDKLYIASWLNRWADTANLKFTKWKCLQWARFDGVLKSFSVFRLFSKFTISRRSSATKSHHPLWWQVRKTLKCKWLPCCSVCLLRKHVAFEEKLSTSKFLIENFPRCLCRKKKCSRLTISAKKWFMSFQKLFIRISSTYASMHPGWLDIMVVWLNRVAIQSIASHLTQKNGSIKHYQPKNVSEAKSFRKELFCWVEVTIKLRQGDWTLEGLEKQAGKKVPEAIRMWNYDFLFLRWFIHA